MNKIHKGITLVKDKNSLVSWVSAVAYYFQGLLIRKTQQSLRWEFIKETKKERERKHAPDRESDQEKRKFF